MDEKKYLSTDGLIRLVANLINKFAEKSHTHTTSEIAEKAYPIGSIYMSMTEANPFELFGFGVWTQIKDTFLLAAGDAYAVGETGGEAEHTLTIDEMPEHRHKLKTDINNPDWNVTWPEWFEYTDGWTQQAGETKSPATHTTSVGGGQSHNNMPPYLAVYIWQRIE